MKRIVKRIVDCEADCGLWIVKRIVKRIVKWIVDCEADCEADLTSGFTKMFFSVVLRADMYACPSCPKHFSNIQNRNRHINAKHSTSGYKCDKCLKVFWRVDSLKRHKQHCTMHRPTQAETNAAMDEARQIIIDCWQKVLDDEKREGECVDPDMDTVSETNSQFVSKMNDTESELESETKSELETESEIETEMESDTETEMETELESEIETDMECEMKSEAESEMETDLDSVAESETDDLLQKLDFAAFKYLMKETHDAYYNELDEMIQDTSVEEAKAQLKPKWKNILMTIYQDYLITNYMMKKSQLHRKVSRAIADYQVMGRTTERAINMALEDHEFNLGQLLGDYSDVTDEDTDDDTDD